MAESFDMKTIAGMHCLDVSIIQMIEAIEEEDCRWGLSGGGDLYEGAIFKEREDGGLEEYRAYHRQPNAAFHEAICRYVAGKPSRGRRREEKGADALRGESSP